MLVSISEGLALEGLLGAILFSELDILAAVELVGLAEEKRLEVRGGCENACAWTALSEGASVVGGACSTQLSGLLSFMRNIITPRVQSYERARRKQRTRWHFAALRSRLFVSLHTLPIWCFHLPSFGDHLSGGSTLLTLIDITGMPSSTDSNSTTSFGISSIRYISFPSHRHSRWFLLSSL